MLSHGKTSMLLLYKLILLWVIRIDCFDTFQKEIDGVKKTSFAFRFVLQSKERTLTDVEANEVADKMYALLKEKGYEVR
jgi:phenylalanyl-tRNA synthetase beta subunit